MNKIAEIAKYRIVWSETDSRAKNAVCFKVSC